MLARQKFHLRMLLAGLGLLTLGMTAHAKNKAAAPPQYQRPTLLIWDLYAKGIDDTAAKQLSAQLAADMAKNPHLEVLTRGELKHALSHNAQAQMLGADTNNLRKIAKRSDAQMILFGDLTRHKNRFQVSLKLFSTADVRIAQRQIAQADSLQALYPKLLPQALALAEAALGLPASNLGAAAAQLAEALLQAGAPNNKRYRVADFVLGQGPFATPYGADLAKALQQALVRKVKNPQQTLTVSGSVHVHHDMLELACQVDGHPKWRAQTRQLNGLANDAQLLPANLDAANKDQAELAAWSKSNKGMHVDMWTNKGKQGVVFFDNETIQIHLTVNRPAWVRLIYHLADNKRVLLDDSFKISAAQVGQDVLYPIQLSPAAPFGIERIQAVAFSKAPAKLKTTPELIEGSRYDLIPDLKAALVHRGFKKQIATHSIDEALVSLTTAKRQH